MLSDFQKFIHFGSIADKKKREEIAKYIHDRLSSESADEKQLSDSNTENFASSIDSILDNKTLKELCRQSPELATTVTQEILDWLNKTKKEIITSENPYEYEQELFEEFSKTTKENFKKTWLQASAFLKETYHKNEIDTAFYDREFRQSLKEEKTEKQASFESVKEHLTDKWSQLLFKKQTQFELEIIERSRKKFCEELYKRMEELKKLQELLEPFTNELGRLWDMSKGQWQRASFDILKHYAELLKHDKALNELAEMLGKMRQAEKEYEEELFSKTVLKTEWKTEHASKQDLIGVHESDDLSSLLPSEAALLSDTTLESVFYKKFAEKKLQTFEYESRTLAFREEQEQDKRQKEKEDKKGPFIICVDTSGSMHGTPETVAKTLCFAILKLAIRDNRKCYLISFSTGIETLNLSDLKNSLDKIIGFLTMSFHGGTDASPAMHEALRMLGTEDYKKADVLVISDFVMPAFDKTVQEQIAKAKENKTKFHSLVIGSSQNQNVIKEFDSNWLYNPNAKDNVLTLVKNLSTL
ncbi:MAG TPA: VWA domain-containing protein [Chitinophagales bacterium]|nr:VWA domain-containing protein [Chitinophagales bacterium]